MPAPSRNSSNCDVNLYFDENALPVLLTNDGFQYLAFRARVGAASRFLFSVAVLAMKDTLARFYPQRSFWLFEVHVVTLRVLPWKPEFSFGIRASFAKIYSSFSLQVPRSGDENEAFA